MIALLELEVTLNADSNRNFQFVLGSIWVEYSSFSLPLRPQCRISRKQSKENQQGLKNKKNAWKKNATKLNPKLHHFASTVTKSFVDFISGKLTSKEKAWRSFGTNHIYRTDPCVPATYVRRPFVPSGLIWLMRASSDGDLRLGDRFNFRGKVACRKKGVPLTLRRKSSGLLTFIF